MRSKKRKNDTLYHVLFWVVVVVLFPVSLSVWFFRRNPLNLSDMAKKLALGIFWGLVVIALVLIVQIPNVKQNREAKASSEAASIEASKKESIAASEEASRQASEEAARKSKLEITFYDMGQADAILITCEDKCMLIDSGDLSVALSAKILEKNISKVDYVVVSTPQNESVGGLARALNHIEAGMVFCTVNSYESDKFAGFREALEVQGKTVTVPKAGETYELGSATVTFLGPVSAPDSVETSLVVKITHQGQSLLFTGFADEEQLTEIANAGGDLKANVVKVGRHGRDNALSENLLKLIDPDIAVISAGEGYGCPAESTLQLLCNADVRLYRTDLQGNIDMVSSMGIVTVSPDRDENIDTYQGITKKETKPSESESQAAPTESSEQPTSPTQDSGTVFETGEATPNASGWRYGRLLSDMQFHRLNCPKLLAVSEEEKEYFDNLRDEMFSWGFQDCEVCHPMQ